MRFKLTAKMDEIRCQRDEARAEQKIIDKIDCSLVDFHRVSEIKSRIAQLNGYLAALEYAVMLLDTNNE
jgi:hypothetical protein